MPPKVDYVTQERFDLFLHEEEKHHLAQERDVLNIRKDIDMLTRTIFGYGESPGMDEKLRRIFEWMETQKELKVSERIKEIGDWVEAQKKLALENAKKLEQEDAARLSARLSLRNQFIVMIVTVILGNLGVIAAVFYSLMRMADK